MADALNVQSKERGQAALFRSKSSTIVSSCYRKVTGLATQICKKGKKTGSAEVRFRRFPVVTGYSGEGPFTEPIAATRLGSGNRSSCPHWHSRPLWRTRQGARQRHPLPGEEQNPLSCK